MSKKEDALYKEWIEERQAKLKGATLEAFNTLIGDDSEARDIFRAGLRESDYYTRLNELSAARKAQETEHTAWAAKQAEWEGWYNEEAPKARALADEKAALAARLDAAEAKLTSIGMGDDVASMRNTLEKARTDKVGEEKFKAIEAKLNTIERGLPGLLAQYGGVLTRVAKENWRVDPAAIVDFSAKQNVDLETAFQRLTAVEREERGKTSLDEQLKKAKEDGRREALSTMTSSPDRQRLPGPSIVDSLKDPKGMGDRQTRVNSAIQDLIEMGQTP